MMVPLRFTRVETGYLLNSLQTSAIGWSRLMFIASPSPALRNASGINSYGLSSIFSMKMPSFVIFALILRSAEQETPSPIGQEAP